jgi:hypothetical protein
LAATKRNECAARKENAAREIDNYELDVDGDGSPQTARAVWYI